MRVSLVATLACFALAGCVAPPAPVRTGCQETEGAIGQGPTLACMQPDGSVRTVTAPDTPPPGALPPDDAQALPPAQMPPPEYGGPPPPGADPDQDYPPPPPPGYYGGGYGDPNNGY